MVLVTLPTRNRPFVDGFPFLPSSRTPALSTHSSLSLFTRNWIPVKPASTNPCMTVFSSELFWLAAAEGAPALSAAAVPGVATAVISMHASAAAPTRPTVRPLLFLVFRVVFAIVLPLLPSGSVESRAGHCGKDRRPN